MSKLCEDCTILPFVLIYHPDLQQLREIVNKRWPIIESMTKQDDINLVPVLTQRSTNRQQNRSNFSSFPQYFQYISNLRVKLQFILLKVVVRLIVFLKSANLICRSTDSSKCFIESLGFRDNESRLYIHCKSPVLMVRTWPCGRA